MSQVEERPVEFLMETPVSPEVDECVHALQGLYTISEETVAQARPLLWNAAEKVAAQLFDERRRETVTIVAGIMDWQLFGKPGDPLPQGLIAVVAGESELPVVQPDLALPYVGYGLSSLEDAIDSAGAHQATKLVKEELDSRQALVNEMITEQIIKSPEYALVMSFDESQRPPQEVPLNSYWRQVRERQIDEGVRTRYGLADGETIVRATAAGRERDRKLSWLDEETQREPEQDRGQEAIERARRYFLPFIKEVFEDAPRDEHRTFDRIDYDPGNGLFIYGHYIDKNGKWRELEEEVYQRMDAVVEAVCASSRDVTDLTRFMGEEFLGNFIEDVMDPRNIGSFSQLVERSIDRGIDLASYHLDQVREISLDTLMTAARFHRLETTLLLKDPPLDEVYPRAYLRQFDVYAHDGCAESWGAVLDNWARLATRTEYLQAKRSTAGEVLEYGPDNFRTTRLLQFQEQEPVGRQPHPDEALSLKLYHVPRGTSPYIPGYILKSGDGSWLAPERRYGFVVDPEGDPYHDCDVPLPDEKVPQLLEQYRAIGLHSLADRIEVKGHCTVDELTAAIAQLSDYAFPEEATGDSLTWLDDLGMRIFDLKSFDKMVSEGRLQVQCTGAASFLCASLELLFGAAQASTVSGAYTIGGYTDRISGAGHAQTVFVNNGHRYILDATPASSEPSGEPLAHYANHGVVVREVAIAPTIDRPQYDGEPVTAVSYERTTLTNAELFDLAASRLLRELKIIFDTPSEEAVYEAVAKLSHHDPIHIALGAVVRARRSLVSYDELKKQEEFIENSSTAPMAVRKEFGIDHYGPHLFERMAAVVSTVAESLRD